MFTGVTHRVTTREKPYGRNGMKRSRIREHEFPPGINQKIESQQERTNLYGSNGKTKEGKMRESSLITFPHSHKHGKRENMVFYSVMNGRNFLWVIYKLEELR
jgi:hypothetical protein